jgi:zinc protease
MRILNRVVASFPNGWLHQALRGEQGIAYVVWGYPRVGFVPGHYNVTFNCAKPDDVLAGVSRVMSTMRRLGSQPLSPVDLERARTAVLTEEFLGRQSNPERAADAALNVLYGVGLDEPDRFIEQVQALTPEVLQTVARSYLKVPVVVAISHEPVDVEAIEAAVAGP